MIKKVLVFGATGHLGMEILAALKNRNYFVAAVLRNKNKTALVENIVDECRYSELKTGADFHGICTGFDIVISALGKSVSPFERSKASFREVDLGINKMILEDAVTQGISKFVYVSALGAESYQNLEYFGTHHSMAQLVMNSGINYAIIEPPALFSAFIDLMGMARKSQLMNMGKGDKKTNPISEKDLAEIIVQKLDGSKEIIPAGGPETLTRREINEIIQKEIKPSGKIRTIPIGIIKAFLPLIRIFDKNTFDKMAFFLEVMLHDTIAPAMGKEKLRGYVRRKNTGAVSASRKVPAR